MDAQTLAATTRVSTGTTGAQANDASVGHAISGNGRHVVFSSSASNLVPGDTNGLEDVFVRDRRADTLTRVSVSTSGGQANGASTFATLSAVGRHVAFTSSASNLVAGDTNGLDDVFVHDRDTRTTTRVSVSNAGSQGDGASSRPALSSDGRYVAFTSDASNLVAGDTNGLDDVFVHDRNTRTTTRVSIGASASPASARLNRAPPRPRRGLNLTTSASAAVIQASGASYRPVLSADGRYVAFTSDASNLVPGDTNGLPDVFIHDRETRATTRVSVSSAGAQADDASPRYGGLIAISADGRYVAFTSSASSLVAGDTNGLEDVFVHDRIRRTTVRASLSAARSQGNEASYRPALSADGSLVVFTSDASSLTVGDTNGVADVFVRDRRLDSDQEGSALPRTLSGSGRR